ncbi:MAG: hypothetical protein ABEJ98_03085 [Candidatus Nanohaloarchaea archaeon]
MHPVLKILAGAVMVVLGVYSSVTFWPELVTMVKAAVGPLLVLVGAFIVWLESDELKMQQEKDDTQGLQRQFEAAGEPTEESSRDYTELLSGTVDEVKDEVRRMSNPDLDEIIEAERAGKNRKTVIEFLEKRR